ncbi:alpha/beta hydrolase [Butyrivibrio sp. MC2013]|uniref:alpha/beta hydrolase n=1 Tax=Butyrivibrio sp. MC2013 TaxID=1280686 RepID=UPI00040A4C23|nr:alpha/beta hydrolase [Butyrivibrio sp. MC2013]
MSKKSRFFLFSLFSAFTAGSIFAGGKLYDVAMKPRSHPDGEAKELPEVTQGRMWVRNHPTRRDIYIDSIDSLRLHATYIPSSTTDEHRYAIIVHGIWDNCEGMGVYARELHKKGMNVLLPDLRGFGASEGNYVGYGGDDRYDIIEWIYWIIKRDKDARIMLLGTSMGAATVLMTTGERMPDNVICAIADSSYTTVKDQFVDVYDRMVKPIIPPFIALPLLRLETKIRAGYDFYDIKPIEAVARSATPTLFIHGDKDTFINPAMCRALFDAAGCRREYCMILGAEHVKSVYHSPVKYWAKIDEFLEHVKF